MVCARWAFACLAAQCTLRVILADALEACRYPRTSFKESLWPFVPFHASVRRLQFICKPRPIGSQWLEAAPFVNVKHLL